MWWLFLSLLSGANWQTPAILFPRFCNKTMLWKFRDSYLYLIHPLKDVIITCRAGINFCTQMSPLLPSREWQASLDVDIRKLAKTKALPQGRQACWTGRRGPYMMHVDSLCLIFRIASECQFMKLSSSWHTVLATLTQKALLSTEMRKRSFFLATDNQGTEKYGNDIKCRIKVW